MEYINEFFTAIRSNLVTFMFIGMVGLFFYYIIRLHINPNYQKFDLADMVVKRDGSLDMGKFRVTILFFGTTYAFFFILHNHHEAFNNYAVFYTALWLTHQVADKVTRTDKDIKEGIEDLREALPKKR